MFSLKVHGIRLKVKQAVTTEFLNFGKINITYYFKDGLKQAK